MPSVFETLNAVNVNDHKEPKGNLMYLSWPWAWGELKKRYPDATYTVYENAQGWFYHTDGKTAWVKTGVTIDGIEHIEYLPVMDNRNRSIPVDALTSFDVNRSIQRSITKAIARFGLGLYIYAGEDLPEGESGQPQRITATHAALLRSFAEKGVFSIPAILERYGAKELEELTEEQALTIIQAVKDAIEKKKKGETA